MLKISLDGSLGKLRTELESWLASQEMPQVQNSSLEEFIRVGREWQSRLAESRWIAAHWPEVFGGRGLSLKEEAIFQEVLAAANAPQILGLFGLTMVGPVLIQYGTDAQKDRFLKKILSAEEIWCQGFSEPNAGSDLAALSTSAERVDGGYKITGQKIWTSFAHIANYCFVLCRTGDKDARYKGLTYLLVDMRSEGIDVRPLTQISGDSEFNEVFFDEVFVPDEMRVGEEGQGWEIAISTLMYERVILTFARHIQSEVALREILHGDGSELAASHDDLIADSCALRALAYKHLVTYSEEKKPGPEGSMDKLIWSEVFQSITKSSLASSYKTALLEGEGGATLHNYLYSRGRTIAAGTSEVQKNIIAERVLGLPRLKVSERGRK